jgi:hypothetical protein
MKGWILLLVLGLLVAGCTAKSAPQTAPQPAQQLPPAPTPPAVQAPPSTPPATILNDTTKVFGGEKKTNATGSITDIYCNATARRLTFTITNNDQRNWQLDQDVPFPPPPGLVAATVIFNNAQVNGKFKTIDIVTNTNFFGPNEKFSQNCGGVAQLNPGQSATCTISPVPLKAATAYDNRNQLFVRLPGQSIPPVTFVCG